MRNLMIAVMFSVSLVVYAGCTNEGSSKSADSMSSASTRNMADTRVSPAQALRQDMRKLWSEHVIWTRDYIVAAIADSDDQQAAAARLMKNQEDIGNAISHYYGAAAGEKLTGLLKEHIQIAVELIKAAKADDKGLVDSTNRRWHENAEQIATFLSQANPNWPRATLSEMMRKHLSTTTDEVMARSHKDWNGDVKAFDAVYNHILMMADALSDGIIKQFPDKFSGNTATAKLDGSVSSIDRNG